MTPTVFVVDDDPAVRDALCQLLGNAGLKAMQYDSGNAFLADCVSDRAGCVVLDLAMPKMDGLEVQSVLKQRNIGLPVIFLSGHGDIPMAVQAVRAGAMTFLEKPISGARLLELVREALLFDEERHEKRRKAEDYQRRYNRLSNREKEVMALVLSGLSNKEIARKIGLSPRTVEVHRIHMMQKMDANNLVELLNMAAEN